MLINIDLLQYQSLLKVKKESGKKKIFDPIRKKYLVWQPEELVRQLLIHYLVQEKNYNKNHLHVERGLKVNGQYKRSDIITYDKTMTPFLLVECKAPNIPLSQAVLDQIATYNLTYQVPYLLISNGMHNYCCQMDYENNAYTFLDEIPNGPIL